MNIDKHIATLLMEFDCVIIPGFGGFVGNYQSASVHPTMHLFQPPSKHLVFNRNLKSNDGLLANELVNDGIGSYHEALQTIDSYIKDAERTLQDGKKLVIEKVGSLYFDIEKNLQFEADTTVNYLLDSYGLTNVQSFPIRRETIYSGRELRKDHPLIEAIPITRNNFRKHIWKAAVLVPLIGLGMWLSMNTQVFDKVHVSMDSLNPFKSSSEQVFQANPEPKTNADIPAEAKKESTDAPANTVESTIPTAPRPEHVPPATMGKYFIIGGCFKVMDNANRMVDDLKSKGFNALICGQNEIGLNRVAFGSYATNEEAAMALTDIQKQNPNAWIFALNN
ncbi:MAG: SPOR domain-containing protein [Bacteroidota bacterium]